MHDNIMQTPSNEAAAVGGGSKGLNPKALELIATVFTHAVIDTTSVDFANVAEKCGYRNAETAKKRYQQIKKQLMENAISSDCGSVGGKALREGDANANTASGEGKKRGRKAKEPKEKKEKEKQNKKEGKEKGGDEGEVKRGRKKKVKVESEELEAEEAVKVKSEGEEITGVGGEMEDGEIKEEAQDMDIEEDKENTIKSED
ncbi:hypothetical protein ABW19_dt0210225 [Dactylella cylindrospora]|nr:hypothetical protein ABW19_dt0210225 [Dactylella cylindrospora]